MTRLDEAGLGAWFAQHQTARGDEAWRKEALPIYRVPQQEDELCAWRRGEPQDRTQLDPWLDVLADEKRQGLITRRVRVFSSVLSDDELRACHWSYPEIGRYEDIRVLRRGEHPVPDLVPGDYWLVRTAATDTIHGVRMLYDPAGRFMGADTIDDEALLAEHVRDWRMSWTLGQSFTSWWAQHGEMHRRRAA